MDELGDFPIQNSQFLRHAAHEFTDPCGAISWHQLPSSMINLISPAFPSGCSAMFHGQVVGIKILQSHVTLQFVLLHFIFESFEDD